MTPADMTDVLAVVTACDDRIIGLSDVAVWHKAIGDLDVTDASDAVAIHYGRSTERIKPAHVRAIVEEIDRDRRRATREAREAAAKEAERLALEAAPRTDRSRELAEMIRETVAKRSTPDASLERAKLVARQMKGRPVIPPKVKNPNAKPIDLSKIPGPEWSDPGARERLSVATLHDADRPCGRLACTRPTCTKERTA